MHSSLIPLFIHALYLPLISPSAPFSVFVLYFPHYTAKLLLSSSMPFQVRPSISISLLLQATSCCLFFSLYHPTSLALPPFLSRFSFCTGWGIVLIRPSVTSSGTSLSPFLSYVLLHGFFLFWIFMREIEPQVELESTLVYDPHLWYFIHGVGFLRTPSIPTMHMLHCSYNK